MHAILASQMQQSRVLFRLHYFTSSTAKHVCNAQGSAARCFVHSCSPALNSGSDEQPHMRVEAKAEQGEYFSDAAKSESVKQDLIALQDHRIT